MKKSYTKNLIAIAVTASFCLSTFAKADENKDMNADMNNTMNGAMHNEEHMHDHGDNPLVAKVMLDQFEVRDSNNTNSIEAQAWIGKDLNKLWLKFDVEKRDGETQDTEVQALYSHAIANYWDLQIGVRKDLKPTPSRTWGVVGVQGLAPYFFNVDAALFVDDADRTAARISTEYDLLFTQRLILSPNIEINLYGQNDPETITGSGLSDAKVGLRLRYEIRREFAPYIGINWNKKFGNTEKFATDHAEAASSSEWVLGVRAWF